jgi:solute carrier family 34 (sodium-dependent phosphate cotransporter)
MNLAEPTTADPRTSERSSDAPNAIATAPTTRSQRAVTALRWTVRLLFAMFLFVGALQLMRVGAASLDILQTGGFLVRNPGSTLGLGWLGALLVLSGSPIAATSLTLVAAGEQVAEGAQHFTELQGFTMLTGSRLGAAFVVLLTAVIYTFRSNDGERKKPVSTAVMALCTTALIYVPSAIIGAFLLNWAPFAGLELQFPAQFSDLIDLVYGSLIDRIDSWPSAILFFGGLGVLLLSFKAIDSVLPQMNEGGMEGSRTAWLKRKWPMFGLGCLVALVMMSVSVALTLLVPLVAKGYAKREHILPYIMGANITTLGDTMLAAFALDSPATVRIVLAQVIASTVVSVIVLTFFYPQVRSGIWRFQRQMVKNRSRLAGFTAALFLVPITIIAISGLAG